MSDNLTSAAKTSQTKTKKTVLHSLEKHINSTLAKLKNACSQENAMTGIQFYSDTGE